MGKHSVYKVSVLTLNTMRHVLIICLVCIFSFTSVCPGLHFNNYAEVYAKTDKRQYAHGISFVKFKDKAYLLWSDAYNTGTTSEGNWTHDVFYQEINLKNSKTLKKKLLISAPEAQEPVSASVAGNGSIICTFEDGYNSKGYTISQRYAIYNKDMAPVKKYPNTIKLGGHSGHSASTEKYHVVFWSYGWVDGGGENNLGTGKSVYVTTIDTKGKKLYSKKISANKRNWWPLAAGSKKYVVLVWQRYVPGKKYAKLMYAVYNPANNRFIKKPRVLDRKLRAKYYSYSVSYLRSSNQFIVIAAQGRKQSNAYLLNEKGKALNKKTLRGALVREAEPAILDKKNKVSVLAYPASKKKIVILRIKNKRIKQKRINITKYSWPSLGISGFYSSSKLNFAVLTKRKLIIKSY